MSGVRRIISCSGWLALVVALCSTSCAPWRPAPPNIDRISWSVDMPKGWMHLRTPDYEMFSKDGPYLQYVLIQDRPLDHRFRFTHRNLDADMLPHEAAEVVVANLSADPKIKNFKLLSNEPATMGRVLGFKLVYSYIDAHGVDIQAVYYGAIVHERIFNLCYTAAKRHYFSKYLDEFEKIYRSLQFQLTS